MVKEEFSESQRISVDPNQIEDPFIGGDALYVEPEGKPERAPKDEVMHLYDLGHDTDNDNDPHEADEIDHDYDNPDANFCDELLKKKDYKDHDWFEDRNNLNITDEKMKKVETWIETQKRDYKFKKGNEDKVNTLKKEQLNFKQRIAYDLIEEWVDKKVSPDAKM